MVEMLRLYSIDKVFADSPSILNCFIHTELLRITQMLIILSFEHWHFWTRNRFNCFYQIDNICLFTIYFRLNCQNGLLLKSTNATRIILHSQSDESKKNLSSCLSNWPTSIFIFISSLISLSIIFIICSSALPLYQDWCWSFFLLFCYQVLSHLDDLSNCELLLSLHDDYFSSSFDSTFLN